MLRPDWPSAGRFPIRSLMFFIFITASKFHDGRPLTSRDVKWTFDSLLQGKIRSTKAAVYRFVDRIDAPDDVTVIFHMKEQDATLLWNLSDGAMGIVPVRQRRRDDAASRSARGRSSSSARRPTGRSSSNATTTTGARQAKLARVRFAVVPDATTQALELRKGSADVAINSLYPPDTCTTLRTRPQSRGRARDRNEAGVSGIQPARSHSERCASATGDCLRTRPAADDRIPVARARRSRRAAFCRRRVGRTTEMCRPTITTSTKANQLLDAAGYPAVNGVRFHITMKTSTDENTRLMVAVMQQQLREAGIVLDIRSFEFATFFSDVQHGAFQMYSLRWIGGNEDPDIFEYAFHSAKFPPNGANRGYYSNPKVDALIDKARREVDPNVRKPLYAEVQRILGGRCCPTSICGISIMFWCTRAGCGILRLNPAGNYDFLRTAETGIPKLKRQPPPAHFFVARLPR